MKTKTILFLLFVQLPAAHAQTQWVLQPFMQYFGHVRETALGARVKGFVGSRPNNPYNVAVAEGYNPILNAPRLLFYHITAPQDTTPLWIIPGGADVEHGDFNGDGNTDLAAWKSTNTDHDDTVLVYLGRPSGIDTIPSFKLPAEQQRSAFGRWICVGDLNNDSVDDLVVTAPTYYLDFFGQEYGKVYVYFGGSTIKAKADFTITGSHSRARLGTNCAIADFNADGFNDLAIRGYDVSVQQSFFGYFNIYLGSAQFDTVADLTGPRSYYSNSNEGLASFDANGDGVTDLLWTFKDSSTTKLSVFIHYGGNDFQQRFRIGPDFVIPAPFGSGDFGNEIANAGDMNGDGDDDIAVAAYSTGQENGIVFIYTAGKALDEKFDAARGQSLAGNFGASVDGIGDINQDGYSDIIVGAPNQPWTRYQGYFGIFLGDSHIPTRVANTNFQTIPTNFILGPVYPNPVGGQINIEFKLPMSAQVEIKVYDILGKEVMTLLETTFLEGQHKVVWNGRNQQSEQVPAGIYLARMRAFSAEHDQELSQQTCKFTVVR